MNNIFNDDLFMLHILEQEGEMDTRTGRLNAAAKDIIAYNALYNDSKIWEIYDKHNLEDITINEHMYVMNKVKGR
jgi:hypothetical protein